MKLSPAAILAVVKVQCFLRWNANRFDDLTKPEPLADPAGWRRPKEYWIRPAIWRDTIFDGDEVAAGNAARTLRDLGLLRTQPNNDKVQAVVVVRDKKSQRAYVVKEGILEWKAPPFSYPVYPPKPVLSNIGRDTPFALISPMKDVSVPSDLSAKLELAVDASLDGMLDILRLQPDVDDRAYQAILRAKTTVMNTALGTQVRVDEGRLASRRHEQELAKLDALIREFRLAEGEGPSEEVAAKKLP